jgi:hypothetical protein
MLRPYLLNIQGRRGLSLSQAVGFDRLNQLRRDLLRWYLHTYDVDGLESLVIQQLSSSTINYLRF